jgi:calcium binding protein 39
MLQEDLLYELAGALHNLPFEARKDTQTIFSHILRFKPPQASSPDPPVVSYIVHNRPEIIIELCRGYEHSQSAMPCGTILREALKFDVIAAIILYDQSKEGEPAIRLTEVQPATPQHGTGIFWRFFHWIDRGSFELSADAFTTFRVSRLRATFLKAVLTCSQSLGNPHASQVSRDRISSNKFRLLLRAIQHFSRTV